MNKTLPSTWLNHTHEIQITYKRPLFESMERITSSEKASNLIKQYVDRDQLDLRERAWILYLTNANCVIGIAEISAGDITSTTIPKRYIFQLALLVNAVAFIIIHNHPSGTLKVSSADKAITKKLCSAGEIMDVKVLDHIIITSEDYVSFADENLM